MGEREVPEQMSTEHLRTEERVIEETVTSPCSPLQCNGCGPTPRAVSGNGVSIAALLIPQFMSYNAITLFVLYSYA